MSGVTADRLLRALWKDEKLLLEALSLFSIERIALPWRRTSRQGMAWCLERRSIFGTVVAECFLPSQIINPQQTLCHYQIGAKSPGFSAKDEGVGLDEAEVKAKVDWTLDKRGWLVVNLPHLGSWESLSTGGWGRKTALGDVAAWVKPQQEARRFKTYVILDEQEADFEGTPDKAMAIVDRNLEHLGFSLG